MSANRPIADDDLRIVPANDASADDVQALFAEGDAAARCQCQWFRSTPAEHRQTPRSQRLERFNDQAHFGEPRATTTAGLVAYLGDEPVGWCAVAPRSTYVRLRNSRMVWTGRQEDPDDDSVWTVSCFVVRRGYRRKRISYALARASVDFARDRGAKAVEGYPLITGPGKDVGSGGLFVGSTGVFAAAGFVEITRPTTRRAVMRLDL
jgi:GNAT superfamily N-acetyltransferase